MLYLAYWGLQEPLGRSLVLPAVERLASRGVALHLVTFEKPADMRHAKPVRELTEHLSSGGVRWYPLRYHKRPKWPSTVFDVVHGILRSLRLVRTRSIDVIHARTFVGGVVGLATSRLTGRPFVYHNEGFYPDEQVDGGVWRAGALPHRLASRLERTLYRRADGVVVLSRRAREAIGRLPGMQGRHVNCAVVPSCVDLTRFRPRRLTDDPSGNLRLVYLGSLGGRYRTDWLAAFVAAVQRRRPDVQLLLLTSAAREDVVNSLRTGGVIEGSWSIGSVPHAEVPGRLATAHAGLFFLSRGLSEHGCSPTKIGEYWAAGLPVVTSANVGDVHDIVLREGVGIVVNDPSWQACDAAAGALLALLQDPDLPARCRAAAERHYSLDEACDAQYRLYEALTAGVRP